MDNKLFGLLNEAHKGLPKVDLKEYLTAEDREKLDTLSEADLKVPINALAAQFIPEVWEKVKGSINASPSGLFDGNGEPLSEEKFKGIIFNLSTWQIADKIKVHAWQGVEKQTLIWSKERQERLENLAQEGHFEQADLDFNTFQDFLKRYPRHYNTPESFILAGFGTASGTISGLFKVIPAVEKARTGEKYVDQERLKSISKNLLPLLNFLASTHLEAFGEVRNRITASPNSAEYNVTHFLPDKFEIMEADYGPVLKIKREVMANLRKSIFQGTPVTECPAKQSAVIAQMYKWYYDLAEKYYFPAFNDSL